MRGRSHDNCCLLKWNSYFKHISYFFSTDFSVYVVIIAEKVDTYLIVQKSKDNFIGCLCTIKDKIWDVIFQFWNLTLLHNEGSWRIWYHDLQTKAQLHKSVMGNFWNTGNIISFCIFFSAKLILNIGSGSSLKGGGLKKDE